MQRALFVLGVIAILIGTVWMLQGVGILPGSVMTGDPFWARVGSGLMLGGLAICGLGLWLGRSRRPR